MALLSGAYFEVDLSAMGISLSGSFLSVSGLGMELEYETYCEGGSAYPRFFFKQTVPQRLVLEQGTVSSLDSVAVLMNMANAGMSVPLGGTITLRDSFGEEMRSWHISGAHLAKYTGPALNSSQAALAVSRIELVYSGCS